MKIDIKTIEHIAELSAIYLTDDEKKRYSGELSAILSYVETLNELETENVRPTEQVTGLQNVVREDEAERTDTDKAVKIVSNFPEKKSGLLVVKGVFKGD